MEAGGTWGESVTRLFPATTAGGVEKAVAIYLERHLFPGITTASNAKQLETDIAVAMQYLTENAQATVNDI